MRVLNDWILVRLDPPRLLRGGLHLVDEGRVHVATVLQSGPGKLLSTGVRQPIGVMEGDKVAFFRWHEEHKQGKQLSSVLKELGDNVALVRADDVLFAWPPGEEHVVE